MFRTLKFEKGNSAMRIFSCNTIGVSKAKKFVNSKKTSTFVFQNKKNNERHILLAQLAKKL